MAPGLGDLMFYVVDLVKGLLDLMVRCIAPSALECGSWVFCWLPADLLIEVCRRSCFLPHALPQFSDRLLDGVVSVRRSMW